MCAPMIPSSSMLCVSLMIPFVSVRDGGSSNTRLDLDRAHSYDVGVLLATLTYYSDSKQIDN